MKKGSLRTYLSLMLVAFSIASYVYINSISVEDLAKKPQCNKQLRISPDEDPKDGAELPEMQIVKELLEKGRRLLPATQI